MPPVTKKRHSLLFHPDFDRWPWVRTRSCPYWGSRARGSCLPITASEELHLALNR